MKTAIDTGKEMQYRLGAVGFEDIVQCVNILLSTVKKTVFLDRALGIDANIIDQPTNRAGRLYQAIYTAIEENEPRVEVLEIKPYLASMDGQVEVKLLIDIKDEYLRG